MNKHSKLELVKIFCDSAIKHHEALVSGDYKKANREAKKIFGILNQLKKIGDEGYEMLMPCLKHENDAVALATANVLLRYATNEAKKVLEKLSHESKGLLGFRAQEALDRWQEGDWHLDEKV